MNKKAKLTDKLISDRLSKAGTNQYGQVMPFHTRIKAILPEYTYEEISEFCKKHSKKYRVSTYGGQAGTYYSIDTKF